MGGEGEVSDMPDRRVAIIGAGIGGLAAAAVLSARGMAVEVIERADRPGGKMGIFRPAEGSAIDAGPTVLTLRPVFETIFAAAGGRLADHIRLHPLTILARHAWPDGSRLDLLADPGDTARAIADFAGLSEAQGFERFRADAARIYRTLEAPFLHAERPSLVRLLRAAGPGGLGALARIRPFATLWAALGDYFRDPRLRQLFARYATYSGASPFAAPATLMLIAHVEQAGLWSVEGGMHRLARALEALARANGAHFRYGAEVAEIRVRRGRACGVALATGERLDTDAVLANADCAALRRGLLGHRVRRAVPRSVTATRSLSAVVWTGYGRLKGLDPVRHMVAFSPDYRAEFGDIAAACCPLQPTVYICAQDRDGGEPVPGAGEDERLLCLVNARADGNENGVAVEEKARWQRAMEDSLAACGMGIRLDPERMTMRMPADFARIFPGRGGALYGSAMAGWRAAFQRPGIKSRIPGLYLAGGSVHPGPGVPMVALSGWMAAERLLADLASTARSRRAATPGGISTASVTTAAMRSR